MFFTNSINMMIKINSSIHIFLINHENQQSKDSEVKFYQKSLEVTLIKDLCYVKKINTWGS